MNEIVSIIVPCYNQEKYLAETLDSVIAQTSDAWECIIVNDGSTDNSEAIIDNYCNKDSRFIKLNQENQGLAASRNNGIKAAKGKYILPLDGDDKIGTQYIELAKKEFEKNPKLTLVYCKAEFFDAKNEPWDLRKYDYEALLFANHIFCSGIFKKEDYLKTSGYDTHMKFGYEDWEFWIQLLKKGDDVVQLDSVQFFYRQRENSMLKSLQESKARQNQMEGYIFNKHRDLYSKILDSDLSLAEIQNVFQTRQTFKTIKKTLTYKTIYKLERAIRSLF
ncbi:glycosyltransferase family A protein [Chryseobacterium tructae]|uniref:Glycosyltransferase family 2 protein n=1 Tax=Chryseobacterium tructae TaxID=1037380 RepID=A0ABV7XSA6_9FLAO|nr:glycosyltransferase family A protein [Chryseobacterium tructae]MDN3691081.1 glycosyltransferase family A protein [Chryseobacterium tructae]